MSLDDGADDIRRTPGVAVETPSWPATSAVALPAPEACASIGAEASRPRQRPPHRRRSLSGHLSGKTYPSAYARHVPSWSATSSVASHERDSFRSNERELSRPVPAHLVPVYLPVVLPLRRLLGAWHHLLRLRLCAAHGARSTGRPPTCSGSQRPVQRVAGIRRSLPGSSGVERRRPVSTPHPGRPGPRVSVGGEVQQYLTLGPHSSEPAPRERGRGPTSSQHPVALNSGAGRAASGFRTIGVRSLTGP